MMVIDLATGSDSRLYGPLRKVTHLGDLDKATHQTEVTIDIGYPDANIEVTAVVPSDHEVEIA